MDSNFQYAGAVNLVVWPALDTLEPPPSAALLSAEEAKGRLREIVEGFFFRRLRSEDGKRIGRLLVKSPPGMGKTREAMHCAIRYQAEQEGKDGTRLSLGDFNEAGVPSQTSIFVPRHRLAEELKGVIEPLASADLAHLFPELWQPEKAAERWLGNNPLNPYTFLIRLWAVIADYRLRGRGGRWLKALVRHGAEAGEALRGCWGCRPKGCAGEGPPRVGEFRCRRLTPKLPFQDRRPNVSEG